MIIFVFNDREKVGTKIIIIIIIIPLQNSLIKQSDKVGQATAAALSNGCPLWLLNSTAASAIYLSRTSATVRIWRHGCACHANGASGDAVDEKVCFASGPGIWQNSSFFISSRVCKQYFWWKKDPGELFEMHRQLEKSVKDGNKSSAGNPSVAKEVIMKKIPAKRSRSVI